MLSDPYPRQILLGPKEIRTLLGLSTTDWYELTKDPESGLPAPVQVGKTRNGHPRKRWKKAEIYLWVETLGRAKQ